MALHALFDPNSAEVARVFAELGVDRTYRVMCQNQHCFRARVSPKPWRIGIESHIRPRPGVWPVRPERLPERRAWVERYEATAVKFSSCRFVTMLGGGQEHPKAAKVRALHDHLGRAASGATMG